MGTVMSCPGARHRATIYTRKSSLRFPRSMWNPGILLKRFASPPFPDDTSNVSEKFTLRQIFTPRFSIGLPGRCGEKIIYLQKHDTKNDVTQNRGGTTKRVYRIAYKARESTPRALCCPVSLSPQTLARSRCLIRNFYPRSSLHYSKHHRPCPYPPSRRLSKGGESARQFAFIALRKIHGYTKLFEQTAGCSWHPLASASDPVCRPRRATHV